MYSLNDVIRTRIAGRKKGAVRPHQLYGKLQQE